MCIFLLSARLDSVTIHVSKALVKYILLEQTLQKKNRVLWHISKWFLFFFCWKHQKIFLQYLLCRPGSVPWDKTHKSMWLDPCRPFKSQMCSHWDCSIHQLQFKFSYLGTDSWGGFCSWLSTLIYCDTVHLPVCLHNFEHSY